MPGNSDSSPTISRSRLSQGVRPLVARARCCRWPPVRSHPRRCSSSMASRDSCASSPSSTSSEAPSACDAQTAPMAWKSCAGQAARTPWCGSVASTSAASRRRVSASMPAAMRYGVAHPMLPRSSRKFRLRLPSCARSWMNAYSSSGCAERQGSRCTRHSRDAVNMPSQKCCRP